MISVDDLVVNLGGDRILDGLSFTVAEGEVVGLIGPNGAGKTTLIRAVDGLVAPAAGEILVDGEAVQSLESRERARRIAVLSQSTAVKFGFSVRDIVAMGRTPYATRMGKGDDLGATAIINDALERTSITDLADRSITEVSGGERQRVLIARAIAQQTPILLLDEPTASLDINHQIATLDFVRSLAQEGKAVLAAIHDLNLAARYCDRLLLLSDGMQRAIGTPDTVLRREYIEPAFGTDVAINADIITGTPRVTPLHSTLDVPDVHVYVIGYGGSAGPICRTLVSAGYGVTVGIVRHGGPDDQLAQGLGIDTIAVPPSAPLDDATLLKHRETIERADATIVSPLNIGDRELPFVKTALAGKQGIVIDDLPFSDRNYAGAAGIAVWDALGDTFVTSSTDNVLDTLATLLTHDSEKDLPQSNATEQQS